MSRKYKCPIYMDHTMIVVEREVRPISPALADQLEAALRQDQHDLHHDAEFADGCDICDKEREEYS
jgi:hypothetical protein